MPNKAARLDTVLEAYRKWLYLPDAGIVEITLATVAANRLPGDPVWLLLTGPPSSGKTEVLNALSLLPDTHSVSTLTEAALLSGTSRNEYSRDATGGLLLEIGDFGIIVLKDFTSLLDMNREKLKALLAALREVFDGSWTRSIGADGGRTLTWKGKLGLIGGVTSSIDTHHAVMSAMGPRFAQYRLPKTEATPQARRALEKTGSEEEMRTEQGCAVFEFLDSIDFGTPPMLSAKDTDRIVALATLAATSRSAVEREGYSRQIELIHDAEAPARLTRMLAQLLRGLYLIGAGPTRARELIVKVGFDCIPPIRRLALEALLNESSPVTISAIANVTKYPEQTIRRAMQDLECHGVVECCSPHSPADKWRVVPYWQLQFNIARGDFPKCQ